MIYQIKILIWLKIFIAEWSEGKAEGRALKVQMAKGVLTKGWKAKQFG